MGGSGGGGNMMMKFEAKEVVMDLLKVTGARYNIEGNRKEGFESRARKERRRVGEACCNEV